LLHHNRCQLREGARATYYWFSSTTQHVVGNEFLSLASANEKVLDSDFLHFKQQTRGLVSSIIEMWELKTSKWTSGTPINKSAWFWNQAFRICGGIPNHWHEPSSKFFLLGQYSCL